MNIFKKILLTGSLIGLLAPAFGQVTEKGNFMIGANFGFSSANSDTEQNINGTVSAMEGSTATQFNIAPAVSYFLLDNFALGIGMDYTFNSIKRADGSEEDDRNALFGPVARLYLPIGNDMSFFIESSVGFGSSTDQSNIGDLDQEISTDVFAVGFGPGFTIFSENAIGIEALVKYNYAESDANFDFEDDNVNVNTITNQLDFSVGLQFYFGRLALDRVDDGNDGTDIDDLY